MTDKEMERLLEEFEQLLSPPTILTRKHTDGTWCNRKKCKREHVIRREPFSVSVGGGVVKP